MALDDTLKKYGGSSAKAVAQYLTSDVNFAGPIAPLIGDLKGTLESTVQDAFNDLKADVKALVKQQVMEQLKKVIDTVSKTVNCGAIRSSVDATSKKLEELKQKRNKIAVFLTKAEEKIKPVLKVLESIDKILEVLDIVVKVLRLLPVPLFPLIMTITNIVSEILTFLSNLTRAFKKAVKAIKKILEPVLDFIKKLLELLASLDAIFKILDIISLILDGLCKRLFSLDDLVQAGLLTADGTLILTNLIDPLLSDKTLDRDNNFIDTRNLQGLGITDPLCSVDVEDKGIWKNNVNYKYEKTVPGTLRGTRSLVLYKGDYFLVNTSHYSTLEGISGPPSIGKHWEYVCSKKDYDKLAIKSPVCELLKGVINIRSLDTSDSFVELDKSLSKLQDSNLPDTLKDSLIDLSSLNLGNTNPTADTESKFFYKGYTLEILLDTTYISIAPRHYAVAKDSTGVIMLQGEKSFSSSTDILLAEIRFKIDTQL